jgi:hypothetical protein
MSEVQTLKLHPDFFESIRPGQYGCDIRYGDRNIQVGPLEFEATDGSQSTTVTVVDARKTSVAGIYTSELMLRGQNSIWDVIDGLKPFYPDINPDTIVTVILYKS